METEVTEVLEVIQSISPELIDITKYQNTIIIAILVINCMIFGLLASYKIRFK
ncbi:MAG: hypothetical protein QXI16_01940 [Sulfolobaceae archaeon]